MARNLEFFGNYDTYGMNPIGWQVLVGILPLSRWGSGTVRILRRMSNKLDAPGVSIGGPEQDLTYIYVFTTAKLTRLHNGSATRETRKGAFATMEIGFEPCKLATRIYHERREV